MTGTFWRDIARRHALRAELALMSDAGLTQTGIDDAVTRAIPHFAVDDLGNLTTATATGETLAQWVQDYLRPAAPHLFETSTVKPSLPRHLGTVGNGLVAHRLAWANQQGRK